MAQPRMQALLDRLKDPSVDRDDVFRSIYELRERVVQDTQVMTAMNRRAQKRLRVWPPSRRADHFDTFPKIILYGVAERNARREFLNTYGCAPWSEAALDVVASLAPVVEIGAGEGEEDAVSRSVAWT